MKTLFIFALAAGAVASSFAQATPEATPPVLPPGPLLNPIPDFVQWTITSNGVNDKQATDSAGATNKPGSPAAAKRAAAKTIVGQSAGDVRHVLITYGNGNKMEFWKKRRGGPAKSPGAPPSDKMEVWEKGGLQYVTSTGWKTPIVSVATPDDLYGDFSWISAANFQGIKSVGGKDCMIFQDTILPPGTPKAVPMAPLINLAPGSAPPPPPPDPESLKIKAVACIEVEHRVPVVLQMGDEVTSYKFELLDPATTLTPPAEAEAGFAAQTQQAQSSVRRSVQP